MRLFSGVKNGVSFPFSHSSSLQRDHGTTQVKPLLEIPLTGYSKKKRILDNNSQMPDSEGDFHRREKWRMRANEFASDDSLRFISEPHT